MHTYKIIFSEERDVVHTIQRKGGKKIKWMHFKKVVAQHLQFQPEVRGLAEKILSTVAAGNYKLFYVGVHVR